jgi:hypothetical protein
LGSNRALCRAVAAFGLVLACFTQSARADEPDASIRMAARELALTGADAFDKQDYVAALERFQRAEALYRAPSISVMVARCLARVGRVVEAVDKYEETRRMPLDASAPEAFQRAVADANAEVDAVRARVARLQLRLPPDAPADSEVRLDDKLLPRALVGIDIPVDPGTHHVVAQVTGHPAYASDVAVAEGGRNDVDIVLSRSEPEAPKPGVPSAPARASTSSHTWGMVLLSGGGVALAAGTVTGIIALGHKSHLDANCHPGCPADMQDQLESFRLNRTLSYVSFGVGLAAVGAGTYLMLHRGPSGSELAAGLFPGGAALSGRF